MSFICPYCLTRAGVDRKEDGFYCSNCETRLYSELVLTDIPRTYVGMVGFSGHGKTTYIASLIFLLKDVFMNEGKWKGFSFMALDMETLNLIYNRVRALTKEARLPEATPVNFPTPFVMKFFNVPYLGNWFVTFYDVGGEVFEHPDRISKQGSLVAKAQSVIFLISLMDCGKVWEERSERAIRLLNTFILGRDRIFPEGREEQNLVVAFTKADLLARDMPRELLEFLMKGTYHEYIELNPEYEVKLKEISDSTRAWLSEMKGMQGFLSLAERNFRSVAYTLLSAIGSAPMGNRLSASLTPEDPKRVLDPFLWTLFSTNVKGGFISLIESFQAFLKSLFRGR